MWTFLPNHAHKILFIVIARFVVSGPHSITFPSISALEVGKALNSISHYTQKHRVPYLISLTITISHEQCIHR